MRGAVVKPQKLHLLQLVRLPAAPLLVNVDADRGHHVPNLNPVVCDRIAIARSVLKDVQAGADSKHSEKVSKQQNRPAWCCSFHTADMRRLLAAGSRDVLDTPFGVCVPNHIASSAQCALGLYG
jgi:hypothetical protein